MKLTSWDTTIFTSFVDAIARMNGFGFGVERQIIILVCGVDKQNISINRTTTWLTTA